MPSFFRGWVALGGHESALRQELLQRRHAAAVGPLLAAPTRWFSLDAVLRHERDGAGRARRTDELTSP
jgi:hypothetical protein